LKALQLRTYPALAIFELNKLQTPINMRTLSAIFFSFLVTIALGQEKSILIKCGKLFDSEQKIFLNNQEILVQGNLIKEVGTNLKVQGEVTRIDLSKYTVLPGLIESHMHLFSFHPIKADLTLETIKSIAMEGDALRTLRAYNRGKTFLDAGITTVKDLGNSGQFLDVALKKAINEGTVAGPRLFVSGPILSSVGGQMPGFNKEYDHLVSEEYRVIKDVEDAKLAVRENINYGADLIKICADNLPNNTTLSVEQMRAIIETAHRYNKRVTAHAVAARSIWEAIIAGVDGIEHGYRLPDSLILLLKKKGVYLVPTNTAVEDWMKYFNVSKEEALKSLAPRHEQLRATLKENVKIVSGSDKYTDLGIPQGEAAKKVLIAYHEAGMKPVDILVASTKTAAEFLNQPNKLGTLKKDAFADIIAIEGDLENDFVKSIFQVRFVMANGKVYKELK
jgi:imidazolonepropionase-like amidohydrolase